MKRLTLFAVLLVFLGAAAAQAQMGDCDGPMGPGMRHHGSEPGDFGLLGCKDELNLTGEQLTKIKAINFEFHNQMIDMKASMEKARLSKRHEMRSDNPDKAKVLLSTKELNNVQGKMAEARVEHRFALRGVLTKEQLVKWQDCQNQCGKRDGKRHGWNSDRDDNERGKNPGGRR